MSEVAGSNIVWCEFPLGNSGYADGWEREVRMDMPKGVQTMRQCGRDLWQAGGRGSGTCERVWRPRSISGEVEIKDRGRRRFQGWLRAM